MICQFKGTSFLSCVYMIESTYSCVTVDKSFLRGPIGKKQDRWDEWQAIADEAV